MLIIIDPSIDSIQKIIQKHKDEKSKESLMNFFSMTRDTYVYMNSNNNLYLGRLAKEWIKHIK